MTHSHISLITTLEESTSEHIIFEICNEKDIANLSIELDTYVIEGIKKNLHIKSADREKTLVF